METESQNNSYYARRQHFKQYIEGDGVEIGALHNPLDISGQPVTRIRYVDRYDLAGLREHYPELNHLALAPVEIVDDGQVLGTVPNESLDFVIANSMIEHTDDPLGTIRNWLSKLRPSGVIYLTVPDKRVGWDERRPLTSLRHMVDDYYADAALRKIRNYEHFRDWTVYIANEYDPDPTNQMKIKATTPEEIEKEIQIYTQWLMDIDYSIHFHVFTHHSFFEMLTHARETLGFPLDIVDQAKPLPESWESIFILRKTDGTHHEENESCMDDAKTLRTAQTVVPFLMDLFAPTRVVDIRCGNAAWLSAFAEQGVRRVLGVAPIGPNGTSPFRISEQHIIHADLGQPLDLEEPFDLALSLATPVDIPDAEADILVQSLTHLAPVVIFAVPLLPNAQPLESPPQWLDAWVTRFADQGYAAFDAVRGHFWHDAHVTPELVQSLLVFVHERDIPHYSALTDAEAQARATMRSVIQPRFWLEAQQRYEWEIAKLTAALKHTEQDLEATQVTLGQKTIRMQHLEEQAQATESKIESLEELLEAADAKVQALEPQLAETIEEREAIRAEREAANHRAWVAETDLWKVNSKLWDVDHKLWAKFEEMAAINHTLWQTETERYELERELQQLRQSEQEPGQDAQRWRQAESQRRELERELQQLRRDYQAQQQVTATLAETRATLDAKNAHLTEIEGRLQTIETTILPEKNAYITHLEEHVQGIDTSLLVKVARRLSKQRTKKTRRAKKQ